MPRASCCRCCGCCNDSTLAKRFEPDWSVSIWVCSAGRPIIICVRWRSRGWLDLRVGAGRWRKMSDKPAELNRDLGAAIGGLQGAFDQFGTTVRQFAVAMEEAVRPFIKMMRELPRIPGEHPADYVLRRGPASGHMIYPDEAWRFRANLDWWPGDDTPDQWGRDWRREH